MMLGYLLARAGIDVLVLEKHADFLRDFRGDTVHPSTLELMHELGVLEDLLRLPHQRTAKVRGRIGGDEIVLADMTGLPTRCKFMMLMPQWNFLNFLAEQAGRYPTFHLKMQTQVKGLVEEEGRIAGIQVNTPAGSVEVRADLVVAADGRNSVLRECAGLVVEDVGAPMDVLWMRLSKHCGDPDLFVYANHGKALVLLDRDKFWQCGLTIPKGAASEMQAKSIEELRATLVENAAFLCNRVGELRDWNDVKLLTVRVDRLQRWYRPDSFASEMRRTPCLRSGVPGSILPSRMPLQPPTSWQSPSAKALPAPAILRKYSAAASSRLGSHSTCRR